MYNGPRISSTVSDKDAVCGFKSVHCDSYFRPPTRSPPLALFLSSYFSGVTHKKFSITVIRHASFIFVNFFINEICDLHNKVREELSTKTVPGPTHPLCKQLYST